ncbi:CMGC/CLK protein kinase Lkh1 [Schizosaccharomyces cryophilus OY26]|uniref:CMGC/CLK protein kinase Lkh1 n=1 Tax=Schizosaccharomyces cryophilus (strain OY26 / ATCC MYA-4695 / CBS 11777 / NBRC 106824 / NRRL Y48691) TaxID=653667 RepID=S9W8I5_SCHCR|nr:CMGC/CLK protein kinase Lkh1 [Schizosaccharomyces cryophilus OY26]EPY54195.1 CMGC/CLK protein kinase Lkh1 [Schizosaccharomyces cryophilus OY26]
MNAYKRRRNHAPDWQSYYKNGIPQEVIVIEDSASPRLSPALPAYPSHPIQQCFAPAAAAPPSISSPSMNAPLLQPYPFQNPAPSDANPSRPLTNASSHLPHPYNFWLDHNATISNPYAAVAPHPQAHPPPPPPPPSSSFLVSSPNTIPSYPHPPPSYVHLSNLPLHPPAQHQAPPTTHLLRPPVSAVPSPAPANQHFPVSPSQPVLPRISLNSSNPSYPKMQLPPVHRRHKIPSNQYDSPASYPSFFPPHLSPHQSNGSILPANSVTQKPKEQVNYSSIPNSASATQAAVPLSPTLAVWLPMTQSNFQPPPTYTYQPSNITNDPMVVPDPPPPAKLPQPKKRKRNTTASTKKVNCVNVPLVADKLNLNSSVYDDDDGHYKVIPNTNFAERYTVIRLLGHGTFGKVIQCYDQVQGKHVAIKVTRAIPKYREASLIELRVLQTISQNDPTNENKCIELKDYFDYRKHICIVTDLFGWSVFDFLKNNNYIPFPLFHIQSLAHQLFKSVAFLHEIGLVHTDLKPENVLLVSNASKNIRLPYRNYSQKLLNNTEIRLIDFGSATFEDEYHSSVVSTRHYRAPEIILGVGWSYPCDIWSLGCIIVELFTGQALFQTHEDNEHLVMMEKVIGPFNYDSISRAGRSTQRFFRTNGSVKYPLSNTPKKSTSPGITLLLDLLRKIFVYDPAKRITAKEALWHPFFSQALSVNF